MIKEFKIFFTALIFLTRIPCCKWMSYSDEYLALSAKYFPLVGIIVGVFGAIVYYLFNLILPHSIAIILSIISTIAITGGFHEDGFADVCDAFGGGQTKEEILNIMKDPRIGTFGVLGITLLLALKYSTLFEMNSHIIPFVIIAGHSVSRLSFVGLMFTHDYVRKNDASSKTLLVAQKISVFDLLIASIFGLLPVFILGYMYFIPVIYAYIVLILTLFLAREQIVHFITEKLGGYTGDCLGALQQATEVLFYMFILIASWKYF